MKDFARFSNGNMLPDGIEASEALDVLRAFFLGDDWYISSPVSAKQAHVYITDAILSRFPRAYKKFAKKNGWFGNRHQAIQAGEGVTGNG